MKKTILPILLATVFSLGAFVGCSQRSSNSSSKSQSRSKFNSSQSVSVSQSTQSSLTGESNISSASSSSGEISDSVSNTDSSLAGSTAVSTEGSVNSQQSSVQGSSSLSGEEVSSSVSNSGTSVSVSSSATSSVKETYSVNFNSNGGNGTIPSTFAKSEGEVFNLPDAELEKDWNILIGWSYNGKTYAIGEQFTMPATAVTFTAVWKSTVAGQPLFSDSIYSYDRIGGGDLELPLDLDGATVYYLKVDGEFIDESMFSYDYSTGCLDICEYFAIRLSDGEHTVKPITDAGLYGSPECVVVTDNSLKTSIRNTTVNFNYGKQETADFGIDFNGTDVKQILYGNNLLSVEDYTVESGYVKISAEYLSKFNGAANFDIVLTNNDVYNVTTYSNIIFATDYDLVTTHNTTQSNIGHNPLYQYYSNVSIVEAPQGFGMSGKVLKITPNTTEVTYDCNGYYTLKGPSCSYMWYDVGYTSGKTYSISFDYATENTSIGTFCFRTESSSWVQNLLLGPQNDGKVHHFSTILTGEQIAYGTLLWAKFIGGGGNVYVDNFTVTEFDGMPTVEKNDDYSSGTYSFNLNANGFLYEVLVDGNKVDGVTLSGTTATIPASEMGALDYGAHTVSVDFGVATLSFDFIKKTAGTVNISQTTANVVYGGGAVKLYGSISAGEKLISVKRAGTNYWDNTYDSDSGIDNYSADNGYINTDYITVATDGITLTEELVNKLYGTQTLTLTFTNGTVVTLTVTSNALFYSDWDEFYINEESQGNIASCQDTAMRSFISTEAGLAIKYTPANAILSHSTPANNNDNGIMTFSNNLRNHWWWEINFPTSGKVQVCFDYEVVTGTKQSNYVFTAFVGTTDNYTRVDTALSGNGTFSKEFDASTLVAFYIHCPFSAKSEIEGSYMIIDNFGFAAVSSGLNQTMANVIYGQQSVKLSGMFESALSVVSIQRTGTNYWDNTYDSDSGADNYSADNGYMNTSYITVQTDGLLISQELINQCYGTMDYKVTLSDGEVYNFTLISNLMFYTNFDETYIHEETEGNIESCQDAAMRSKTTTSSSGNAILYTPGNAVQSHAITDGSTDNGIMTFSNNLRNHWWWEFDFPANSTIIVFFDYTVNAQPADGGFKFTYMHGGDGTTGYERVSADLTGSGRFYIEIDSSDFNAFYIHCQSSIFTGLSGASMIIDNFGFGIKA